MTFRNALVRSTLALTLAALAVPRTPLLASSHREAPITALDHKADITDWYAFVSPEHPDRVVLILNIDPFLEPSNGPNYFPFDPHVLYEMKIDNDHNGLADVVFQFRFKSEIRNPGLFTGFAGGIAGVPAINSLDGPGSEGLSERQTYTVTMISKGHIEELNQGQTLFAVPTNVGPRTMPNYAVLRQQGIYTLSNGIRIFAGTVTDPFFIDWGTTSRRRLSVLGQEYEPGGWAQVQRLGNPLINEVIIGTGSKDRFSMDAPDNDAQFSNFFLNPLLATILGSIGVPVPPAPRTDLLPLVQYMAPICPGCTPDQAGPIADLLRLNTGIPPTPAGSVKRLGFLAGDVAGFPNGRRPTDDVVDISLRAVGGILVDAKKFGTPLGDGVNVPSAPLESTFPFLGPAYDGRNNAHNGGPGQPGCPNQPGGICPAN